MTTAELIWLDEDGLNFLSISPVVSSCGDDTADSYLTESDERGSYCAQHMGNCSSAANVKRNSNRNVYKY